MLITKHFTELLSLFIDDVYGELPSRIFSALLTRGRSSMSQLANYTSLSPRQLRHGLAVLIQHNLLYYSIGGSPTVYEANPDIAYNLVRSGKILDLIESLHGEAGKDVVQSLLVLGNTKVGDLREAYGARLAKTAAPQTNGNGTAAHMNGDSDPFASDHEEEVKLPAAKSSQAIESLDHLNSILCRLVEDELLIVVGQRMFQSFDDIHSDVQSEVEKKHWPQGVRGTKEKEKYLQKVAERLRELREQSKALKRKLDSQPASSKRRKVENGDVSSGVHESSYSEPPLDPDVVLRVNHEKCLVQLRNQRLAGAVSESLGEVTSQVYAVVLSLLTKKVARCRPNPTIDAFAPEDDDGEVARDYVTTDEIFDHLSPGLDVGSGIGKVDSAQLDLHGVERIRRLPPKQKEPYEDDPHEDNSDDEDENMNMNGHAQEVYDEELFKQASDRASEGPTQNGGRDTKVKFREQKGESRLSQMRQHLLLLCENTQGFLRHRGNGQWTVDFGPLVRRVQETELDTVMERKIGRLSLRLIRVLRARGRLDEKALPTLAMMAKGTVHKTMLEMQMHGFIDVQEVPKDNSRNAKMTIFLWFAETDRSLAELLDSTYKTMLRILQVREVHRMNAREVLRVVERHDVKGREKEALEKKYFERYDRYRAIEDKIIGHLMRLDDLVSVLREF